MKENKYDQSAFFEKYSGMDRSTKGLAGAGEWQALRAMLPSFRGKRVLDLGCGFGWHCLYAAEGGARQVVGLDISEKMLAVAREKNSFPNVEYLCTPLEDYVYPAAAFDVVLSSLTFHYIADFAAICERVSRCLVSGGDFVFSVEHPIFTAQGMQDWHRDETGEALHWPVDRYFEEGRRSAAFLGETVIKYHRTLTTYLGELAAHGFAVEGLVEPQPDAEKLATVPGMADELRRPMMLIVAARKR